MRIDKFLSTVNITKRRTVAQDMLAHHVVFLNGYEVKPSKDVKVGDMIEIRYLEHTVRYQVLAIPATKTVPKSAKAEYVKELA